MGSRGLPPVRIEIPPEVPPGTDDIALAERVMRAWERAVADERWVRNRAFGDVWEMVQHEFHGEFVAALRSRQPAAVAAILSRFFRHNISYGMGGSQVLYDALLDDHGNAQNAALTVDRLASLAEALDLLPYENPEQGRWGGNLYLDPVELGDRVEKRLGIPICPPTICGYFGIPLRGGLLFATTCNQLYAASRLAELITDAPLRRVCELGGGYGGCALYSYSLGLHDYRLFDLPTANVLQGYYLLKALPAAKIVLYGEEETDDAICVYPYWLFRKQANASFGAALNQDSLPEIAPAIAVQYLRDLGRTSHFFLSINQEGQGPAGPPGVFQIWCRRWLMNPERSSVLPGIRSGSEPDMSKKFIAAYRKLPLPR